MRRIGWLGVALALGISAAGAFGTGWRKDSTSLEALNRRLGGRVVDHTANHGKDHRIWSRSLYQRRDLYVYLPPNFDPDHRYPLLIWLHGFAQDEQSFATEVVPLIDAAICSGKLPPLILAAPDGSLKGEPCACSPGSFFLNTKAGDFEDFVLQDVWDFLCKHYPIHCDRGAHVLAGVSMGGFAAYNFAMRHKDAFGVAIGIAPPLNLRWMNKKGEYFANFNPKDWGWRTDLKRSHEAIARFYGGLIKLRLTQVIDPIFGRSEEAMEELIRENPIEMLGRYGIHDGDLEMYVAYGGKDEFNIDAQVESFLYVCKHRGITVGVGYEPNGRHDQRTAEKLVPGIVDWLAVRLAPYSCGGCSQPCR